MESYSRDCRYQNSIMTIIEFFSSLLVPKGKKRILREAEQGKRQNKGGSLINEEVEKFVTM